MQCSQKSSNHLARLNDLHWSSPKKQQRNFKEGAHASKSGDSADDGGGASDANAGRARVDKFNVQGMLGISVDVFKEHRQWSTYDISF